MKPIVLLSLCLFLWMLSSLLEIRALLQRLRKDALRLREMNLHVELFLRHDTLQRKLISRRLSTHSSPQKPVE